MPYLLNRFTSLRILMPHDALNYHVTTVYLQKPECLSVESPSPTS